MLTRSKSKMSGEIQACVDEVMKTVVSKEDMNSLKA